MKFVFILAEKAFYPITRCCAAFSRSLAAGPMHGGEAPGASCSRRRTARGPGRCGSTRAAARPTVARACMRNCEPRDPRRLASGAAHAGKRPRAAEAPLPGRPPIRNLQPDRAQRGRSEVRRRSRSRLGHRRDCDPDSRGWLFLAVMLGPLFLSGCCVGREPEQRHSFGSRSAPKRAFGRVALPQVPCTTPIAEAPTPATHTERSWPRTVWWRA